MPKCKKCQKRKPKKQMITNATCNSCYIDVSLSSKPNLVISKCKHCEIEYKTTFINDTGYCKEHYYIEYQYIGVSKSCNNCNSSFYTKENENETMCNICVNGMSRV